MLVLTRRLNQSITANALNFDWFVYIFYAHDFVVVEDLASARGVG